MDEQLLTERAGGLPRELDRLRRDRLKALGNATVPQVAWMIFRAIERHADLG